MEGLIRFIGEAVRAVPAVKYAVGVGGVLAVVALIFTWMKFEPRIALISGVVMFLLMGLLVVFARVAALPHSILTAPAVVFTWFILLMFMLFVVAMFLSVFIGWPLRLQCWMTGVDCRAEAQQTVQAPPSKSEKEHAPAYLVCRVVENGIETVTKDVRRDGLDNQCKTCENEVTRKAAENQMRAKVVAQGHKDIQVIKSTYVPGLEHGHRGDGGYVYNRYWDFDVTYDPVYKLAASPACGVDTAVR